MAHTPEAEIQEEKIGEQQQEEEMEEEVKTYVPPKCAKRVYQSKAKEDLWEDDRLQTRCQEEMRKMQCEIRIVRFYA